ncbi:MAG: hypothetical protein WBW73_26105 [Rhodoplanes sp.]
MSPPFSDLPYENGPEGQRFALADLLTWTSRHWLGWGKTIGGLARPMLRGIKKLDFNDLIKLPRLIGAAA